MKAGYRGRSVLESCTRLSRWGLTLNYRNPTPVLVKANTVTVGSEVVYYTLKGRKFSILGIAAE